ncbi:MAG: hypothetical protein JSW45_00960 [Thiotrichales bacterium]|nr:MAG: hypothetical protein JSW45_00960 [Thiotrichales bacterium]
MYTDINPQLLQILGIIIAVIFVIVVIVVYRDARILRKSHEDIDHRVEKLRLGDMIARLNIPFSKYDHNTSDLDKERHIWACEHCPHPDKCERMFDGEDLDPAHFCPNYRDLKKIKG